MAVITQEIGWEAVVGIIVMGPNNLSESWDFVLSKEHVQVTSVRNVAAGHCHGVFESRIGSPNQPRRFLKSAVGIAFEQKQSASICTKEIRKAVTIEIRYQSCAHELYRI